MLSALGEAAQGSRYGTEGHARREASDTETGQHGLDALQGRGRLAEGPVEGIEILLEILAGLRARSGGALKGGVQLGQRTGEAVLDFRDEAEAIVSHGQAPLSVR
ncbi:hypothetical protein MKK58_07675 [Methylobacterium sp. J-078]|uniref:hypothetical protein n=1 Tax=Methylobacterium sp. J-078 TaxID=2836657 RepID=UPI001FBB247E|nr:hypothetical protein [Methylobacterium sp. J-078]MCJ2044412.1 hypothetical protein [Methylobacterium sp. J-078]